MLNEKSHWLESKIIFITVLLCIAFVGWGYWKIQASIKEIRYNQETENLGCMLVTKYNKAETCNDGIMANGQYVWIGACAISPDLRNDGLLMLGDIIYIPDYGHFVVSDYTHKKHKRLIDLYTDDLKEAKKHAAKRKRVYLVSKKRR